MIVEYRVKTDGTVLVLLDTGEWVLEDDLPNRGADATEGEEEE